MAATRLESRVAVRLSCTMRPARRPIGAFGRPRIGRLSQRARAAEANVLNRPWPLLVCRRGMAASAQRPLRTFVSSLVGGSSGTHPDGSATHGPRPRRTREAWGGAKPLFRWPPPLLLAAVRRRSASIGKWAPSAVVRTEWRALWSHSTARPVGRRQGRNRQRSPPPLWIGLDRY